jgi:hypothetical protein
MNNIRNSLLFIITAFMIACATTRSNVPSEVVNPSYVNVNISSGIGNYPNHEANSKIASIYMGAVWTASSLFKEMRDDQKKDRKGPTAEEARDIMVTEYEKLTTKLKYPIELEAIDWSEAERIARSAGISMTSHPGRAYMVLYATNQNREETVYIVEIGEKGMAIFAP